MSNIIEEHGMINKLEAARLRLHYFSQAKKGQGGSRCQDSERAVVGREGCLPGAVAGVRRGWPGKEEAEEINTPSLSLFLLFSCLCFPVAKSN